MGAFPVKSLRQLDDAYRYREAFLGTVVTFSEACYLWGKSDGAMSYQVARGKLAFRRTIPAGNLTDIRGRRVNTPMLITVASLVKLWGEPRADLLKQLYDGGGQHGGSQK